MNAIGETRGVEPHSFDTHRKYALVAACERAGKGFVPEKPLALWAEVQRLRIAAPHAGLPEIWRTPSAKVRGIFDEHLLILASSFDRGAPAVCAALRV